MPLLLPCLLLKLLSPAHAADSPLPVPSIPPPQTPTARCPPEGIAAVTEARRHLGTRYRWGGRLDASHPGLDCLGLLYQAWGTVTGTSWRKYPVNPSVLVRSGLLGAPVPGMDGVIRSELKPELLCPGDILYLLMADYEIPDSPLWQVGETRYWPWHTALFSENGNTLEAHPGGVVKETPLNDLLFDALYVTRRSPPAPTGP